MKKLLACVLFGTTLLVSGLATAAQGYVCSVSRQPGSGKYGTAGHVVVSYTTAPGCTGTSQGSHYYCSPSPTSTSCPSSTAYHYAREDLNSLASMLHNAAIANTKVQHDDDAFCIGGKDTCSSVVYLYSEP